MKAKSFDDVEWDKDSKKYERKIYYKYLLSAKKISPHVIYIEVSEKRMSILWMLAHTSYHRILSKFVFNQLQLVCRKKNF